MGCFEFRKNLAAIYIHANENIIYIHYVRLQAILIRFIHCQTHVPTYMHGFNVFNTRV